MPILQLTDPNWVDRTLKGIGIFEASPTYNYLPGFERSVLHQINDHARRLHGITSTQRLMLQLIDPRET